MKYRHQTLLPNRGQRITRNDDHFCLGGWQDPDSNILAEIAE